ncbi:hypothetical protein KEM54_002283 [Ascosphaera aggregata]|nr:hypothetical protein KEM54_002283 [Ascosphaera aggregata]
MSADSSSGKKAKIEAPSTPISSGSPVISTLVTSSSPLISSKYVPLTSRTSHPVSGVNSGSAPFPSHLSTGYTTPVTPKTTSMASSLATAPMVSSTPVACLTTRNITLNFDNLPINHRDKESPRLPSPYEHFYFSKGWIYGRSASVTHKQFPASSGNSMAAYLPSLSGNASAPGSFGIIPNDAKVAHGFKMRSLRFGCNGLNAPKDEICRVLITGIPLEQGIRKHAIEVDIEPCMFASGCALAVVNFGQDMFPALRAMQFSASIGNQTVGWFIDDINMGVEVGCDSTHHGTVPVHRGMQHGIVRKRSISYEPFTEPAQDFAK